MYFQNRLFISFLIFFCCISVGFSSETTTQDNSKKYIAILKKAVTLLKAKDNKSRLQGVSYLEKAAKLEPTKAKAWCILGKFQYNQKELSKSIYPLKQCSSIDPSIENRLLYGQSLFDYGSVDVAKTIFATIYEEDPNNQKAIYFLGLSLAWTDECDQATSILDLVRPTQISDNNYYTILYTCYEAIDNTKKMKAMDKYRDKAIPSKEGKAFNLAVSQMNNMQYQESIKNLQFVIAAQPELTEAYYILGSVYNRLRDFSKSVPLLERAVWLIKRGYRKEISVIDVFTVMYDAYVNQQPPDHNNGLRVLEHLLLLYPNDLRQLFNYYHIKQYISSLNGLLPLKHRAMKELINQKDKYLAIAQTDVLPPLTPIRASVFASMPFLSEVNELYSVYAHSTADKHLFKQKLVKDRPIRRLLRVGILSGDLYYNHPMMHLMRTAFKYIHNCEPFFISIGSKNVANITRIYEELDIQKEVDVSQYKRHKGVFDIKKSYHHQSEKLQLLNLDAYKSDEQGDILYALDLDLLVDLSGYTQNGNPLILARRPAVIQANYLGFPAQTNADWIDYNLQDSIVSPPQYDQYYTDKLVYLPYFYASDHHNKIPDLHPFQKPSANTYLRHTFQVPESGLLYCFPNQLYKISSDLIDSWANILRSNPTAYLWLLRHPTEGEKHIREEFTARGIYQDRLVFSNFEDNKIMYMLRTSICDVILDSPSWSAGATGLDAYWSGVPIINLPGDRTVERLGLSIMRATYFNHEQLDTLYEQNQSQDPPLITVNMKDYEDVALKTQQDPYLRTGIRFELVKKVGGEDFDVNAKPVKRNPLPGGQFDIHYWIDQWVMSFYAMYDVMYVMGKPWIIYAVSVDIDL